MGAKHPDLGAWWMEGERNTRQCVTTRRHVAVLSVRSLSWWVTCRDDVGHPDLGVWWMEGAGIPADALQHVGMLLPPMSHWCGFLRVMTRGGCGPWKGSGGCCHDEVSSCCDGVGLWKGRKDGVGTKQWMCC